MALGYMTLTMLVLHPKHYVPIIPGITDHALVCRGPLSYRKLEL